MKKIVMMVMLIMTMMGGNRTCGRAERDAGRRRRRATGELRIANSDGQALSRRSDKVLAHQKSLTDASVLMGPIMHRIVMKADDMEGGGHNCAVVARKGWCAKNDAGDGRPPKAAMGAVDKRREARRALGGGNGCAIVARGGGRWRGHRRRQAALRPSSRQRRQTPRGARRQVPARCRHRYDVKSAADPPAAPRLTPRRAPQRPGRAPRSRREGTRRRRGPRGRPGPRRRCGRRRRGSGTPESRASCMRGQTPVLRLLCVVGANWPARRAHRPHWNPGAAFSS